MQSFLHTSLRFQEKFYKTSPNNAMIISFVEDFRRLRIVLKQCKGHSDQPTIVCSNETRGRVL